MPNDSPSCLLRTTTSAITCGAELRGRRADRIRRLQRMATLHAPTAAVAPADVQIKLPDDDARDRQLFLILVDDSRSATTGPAQSGQCAGSGAS